MVQPQPPGPDYDYRPSHADKVGEPLRESLCVSHHIGVMNGD